MEIPALTTLEEQVVRMLLAGDSPILEALRVQAEHLAVSSREVTGVGFFTRLVVPERAASIGIGRSLKLGDVNGTADNVRHGLGFLLYIENGFLSALEGYTYDEPWPEDVRELKLSYSNGPSRDLGRLKGLAH